MKELKKLLSQKGATGKTRWVDTECPGIGIRINDGYIIWIGRYQLDGKTVNCTIGETEDITYDEAREHLRALNAGEIARGQRCPGIRLEVFSTIYMREWSEPRIGGADDQRRLDQHLLPAFGKKPMIRISSLDVKYLHAHITKTDPAEADSVIQLLEDIFSKASYFELIPKRQWYPTEIIRAGKLWR